MEKQGDIFIIFLREGVPFNPFNKIHLKKRTLYSAHIMLYYLVNSVLVVKNPYKNPTFVSLYVNLKNKDNA